MTRTEPKAAPDRPLAPEAPCPGRPWLLDLPLTESSASDAGRTQTDALPADTLGLALSGGGIRSASFCLGVLQALARAGWLRHVDYLSTVSGGGYIGSFLGRWFDALRGQPGEPDATPGLVQQRVVRGLTSPNSEPINWLRRHANYLAPGGPGDASINFTAFLRNLLAVFVVLGVTFLAVFGVLNAVGYSHTLSALALRFDDLVGGLTPLNRYVLGPWSSPWLVLAELALWLAVVPLTLGYWLVSQDLPEAFVAAVLLAAAIVVAGLTVLTGAPLPLAVLAAAVAWAGGALAVARRATGPADPANPFRLSLARNHLTRRLAAWLGTALALAMLAAIDTVGRRLALRTIEGGLTVQRVSAWLIAAGSTVLASAAMLRAVLVAVLAQSSKVETLRRAGRRLLLAAAALLLGAVLPLVALAFVSHLAYAGGKAYGLGLAVTATALAVALLLGSRECVPFVNRSGPFGIYAGRLSRTFLAAVNPARGRHPEGQDVTRDDAGDNVPLARYRPELAGGPLHLINCAVNETVDVASYRAVRDRHAENLAVGPAGLSVARDWHGLWKRSDPREGTLEPLGSEGPDPLLGQDRRLLHTESLTVRDWVGISGAAVGPGKGRRTSLVGGLVLTLANARLGYWWDSGLEARHRLNPPLKRGVIARLGNLAAGLFRAQWLLLSELTGRFGGPWLRHWHLSDGGFFEVTAAYELLRRRVPFVILCDASEDPAHRGADLARLVMLARVDLGAEVTGVSSDPRKLHDLGVPEWAAARLGTLDDLLATGGGLPREHAALLRVDYPEPPPGCADDPWLARQRTWILYIKATRTGDEPADVRGYAAANPDFPNEPTLDQVFDEPQFESYRTLGEHAAAPLFGR